MAMPCVMRARVAAPASTSGARAHAGGRATRARVPASRVRPETGAKVRRVRRDPRAPDRAIATPRCPLAGRQLFFSRSRYFPSATQRGERALTLSFFLSLSQRDADGLSLRGASFPLPAVMAPDAATVEASHPRRGGMGRRFADEESLSTPGDDAAIRNFWYPVHFEAKLAKSNSEGETFVLFGEKLTLRREKDVTNAAKAVAPLWGVDDPERLDDSSTYDGVPSPTARAATPDMFVCESLDTPGRFLPIGVQDGLIMVWPGTCRPSASLPVTFRPPEGYTTHAELIIECVPVEHGLLMENLLDLAHAPFTHTGTFAKGWGVPNFVEFVSKQMRKPGDGWHDMANALANAGGKNAPVSVKKLIGMNGDLEGQQGSWNPYPIDMKFVTPCMVDSHIGMSQAGAAGGGGAVRGGRAVRGVLQPPAPAARLRAGGAGDHAAALPHVAGLRGLGQVRARDRAGVDGDGEPSARRGFETGHGAAGPNAAGRTRLGAPGGVRQARARVPPLAKLLRRRRVSDARE
jgi:hypothetical protein